MTVTGTAQRLPGDLQAGTWGRFTTAVHRVMVLTAALVLAVVPMVVIAVLMPPGLIGLVTTGASGVVGTVAFSAVLAAWRSEGQGDHPQPWRSFWRGWRRNARDVALATLPGVLLLTLVSVLVTYRADSGVGPMHTWLLLGLGAVTALVTTRALVLASVFTFRTRDVWRLAVYTLYARPRASVALFAIATSTGALLWFAHEGVLLLVAAVLGRLLLHHEQPVIDHVRDAFTTDRETA